MPGSLSNTNQVCANGRDSLALFKRHRQSSAAPHILGNTLQHLALSSDAHPSTSQFQGIDQRDAVSQKRSKHLGPLRDLCLEQPLTNQWHPRQLIEGPVPQSLVTQAHRDSDAQAQDD
ncbi:hypothetical protein D3C77_630750 [compost metagenome]